MTTATAEQVAAWMWKELQDSGRLSQRRAAREIRARFGSVWLHKNENSNDAISKDVLKAFRLLHQGRANWSRYALSWELVDE